MAPAARILFPPDHPESGYQRAQNPSYPPEPTRFVTQNQSASLRLRSRFAS